MGEKLNNLIEDIIFFLKNFHSNKQKIKGKCNACGLCCRTIVFFVGKNLVKTEEQFELLKRWDKKYNNFEINGKSSDGALFFKCKALKNDGKCKVYHFRSLGCRLYPKYKTPFFTRGEGLKKGCGFYIEKEKKFDDFMKNI